MKIETEALSNVQVRLNVYHCSRNRPKDIQAGMTWHELNQYIELFWSAQRKRVLEKLTASQKYEKEELLRNRAVLPDPYQDVCDSHRLFLVPRDMQGSDVWGDSELVADVNDTPVLTESIEARQNKPGSSLPEGEPVFLDVQQQVIRSPERSKILVLAAPGTGKTYTVLRRLEFLATEHLAGDLSQVLMVSFSRITGHVLRKRLINLLGENDSPLHLLPQISTLDSFGGKVLHSLGLQGDGDHTKSIRDLADVFEGKRSMEHKRRAVEYLRERIKFVIVDEVQDVVGSRARLVYLILKALKDSDPGFLLLGDIRQYITGYQLKDKKNRASGRFDPRPDKDKTPFWLLRKVGECYEGLERVEFEKSRRFGTEIQPLIDGFKRAMDSPEEGIYPGEKPDRRRLQQFFKEHVSELEHPIDLGGALTEGLSTAVLARSNSLVRQLEVACSCLEEFGRRIKVNQSGAMLPGWIARVFQSKSRDATFSRTSFAKLYLERIGGSPALASEKLDWLCKNTNFDFENENVPILVEQIHNGVLRQLRQESSPSELRGEVEENEVLVSTIHGAKGREFDVVVIVDEKEGSFLSSDEESRILYVAATRARSKLFRVRGKAWLPDIFIWKPDYILPIGDEENQDPNRFFAIQNALWDLFAGPSKTLKLHSPNKEKFVLELEGCSLPVPWAFELSQEFEREFGKYCKEKIKDADIYEDVFACRISRLNTIVDNRGRLILTPEMSGEIKKQ